MYVLVDVCSFRQVFRDGDTKNMGGGRDTMTMDSVSFRQGFPFV